MGAAESATSSSDPDDLASHGHLPAASSISFDPIYKQHHFNFKQDEEKLVTCDAYAASLPDPLNHRDEPYLVLGLRTKFDGAGVKKFGRPQLKLVVVVDMSGSMNAHFPSGKHTGSSSSKLEVVKQALVGKGGMLDQLRPGDQVSIVFCNIEAKVIQDLVPIERLLRDRVNVLVEKQGAVGATSLAVALQTGMRVLVPEVRRHNRPSATPPPPPLAEPVLPTVIDMSKTDDSSSPLTPGLRGRANTFYCTSLVEPPEYRILLISDEDVGQATADHEMALAFAARGEKELGIHTTFVGLGLTYSAKIVKRVSEINGCHCMSVHSEAELRRKLVDEFNYNVCPIAYNIRVRVEADGQEQPLSRVLPQIEAYHAHADACPKDEGTELLRLTSAFPKPGDATTIGVQSPLAVVKLAQPLARAITITTSYEDRLGEHRTTSMTVHPGDSQRMCFRKAVALTRMTILLKVCLLDEHSGIATSDPRIRMETGIGNLPNVLLGEASPSTPIPEGDEDEPCSTSLSSINFSRPIEFNGEMKEQTESLLQVPQPTRSHSGSPHLGTSPDKVKLLSFQHEEPVSAWLTSSATASFTRAFAEGTSQREKQTDQTQAKPTRIPYSTIPISNISHHYRSILNTFKGYMEREAENYRKEAEGVDDEYFTKWIAFLQSFTDYITDDQVEQASAQYFTPKVLCDRSATNSAFDHINSMYFKGRLREQHRSTVTRVQAKRMKAFVRETVNHILEKYPSILIATPHTIALVRLSFWEKCCEGGEEIPESKKREWEECYDPLLIAALRDGLNKRIFTLAKQVYLHNRSDQPTVDQIVDKVMVELVSLAPELLQLEDNLTQTESQHRTPDERVLAQPHHPSSIPRTSDEFKEEMQPHQRKSSGSKTGSYAGSIQDYLKQWVTPVLVQTRGECKWCDTSGMPIGNNEEPPPEVQCPTQ